jgi:hypothetical protein
MLITMSLIEILVDIQGILNVGHCCNVVISMHSPWSVRFLLDL